MRTFTLVSLLMAVLGLTSCNTAIGFSRDIRSLGEGMENTAYGRDWKSSSGGQNNPSQPAY